MSDGSDESDDRNDEEEDSTDDDAAHDGEGCDDRYRLPIGCGPDQDKCYELQNKVWNLQKLLLEFIVKNKIFSSESKLLTPSNKSIFNWSKLEPFVQLTKNLQRDGGWREYCWFI